MKLTQRTVDTPELLKPWDQSSLQMYPASRTVNSSKAAGDDPSLIERIEV